jgi:hypothetical protein
MEEAYALYQGVLLVQGTSAKSYHNCRRLKKYNSTFCLGNQPKKYQASKNCFQIKLLLSPIHVNFIHILHGNNKAVDNMENQEIGLTPGHMKSQGRVHFTAPP